MNAARSRPRRRLVVLLLLVAAGTGAVSWQLSRGRAALQSAANLLRTEQAQHNQQLLVLDERRVALQRELATAARVAAEKNLTPAERQRQVVLAAIATLREPAVASVAPLAPRRPRPPSSTHFAELFADPHYAQLFTIWWRQFGATRYAPLFGELSRQLSPEAFASFRDLLVQRYMADAEVDSIMDWQARRDNKPSNPNETLKVKKQVVATFDDEIRQTYGEETLNRLHAFESGTAARQMLLDKLALRLSYSAAPLDQAQSVSLVKVFDSAWRASFVGDGPPSPASDAFVAEAKSVLKPEQMAALLQLQTELAVNRSGSSVSIRNATPPPAPPRAPGGG